MTDAARMVGGGHDGGHAAGRRRAQGREDEAAPLGGGGVAGSVAYTREGVRWFPSLGGYKLTTELPTSSRRGLGNACACSQQSASTMSKPSFQRMSQDQETQLGHNCALDIYSDPQAFRKVRAPLTLSRLHRCARAPPLSLLVVAALFGSAPLSAPSAPRPKASR